MPAVRPSRSGSIASIVRFLLSRYSGLCTISAYAPNEALLTNGRSPIMPEVDAHLLAVGQRAQAGRRVVPIQAEIQREVIAGAGADHQHRHVVLGGDAGDQRLGAVAAGHAQAGRRRASTASRTIAATST